MSLDNPICIFCEENVRAWDDDVLNVEIDEPGAPTAPARLHHFVAFCGGRFVAADQKFAAAAAFWVSVLVPVRRSWLLVIKDIWRLCPLGLRVACSMSEKKLCIVDDLSLDSFISS